MYIAIDGACKRNGQPTCNSLGVAWITTETEMLYKSIFEIGSTSQRGEINGLLAALLYATEHNDKQDVIIVTDSEYLYNTVMLSWYQKWYHNNWIGASGPVKNADKWETIYNLITNLEADDRSVVLEWTKGHIMSYTPGNIKAAMVQDMTGIELYTRLLTVANRVSERERIIKDFNCKRVEHNRYELPETHALDAVIGNTMADCLASFLMAICDQTIA